MNTPWKVTTPVVVVGAKDGRITGDLGDKQCFTNLAEARRVFPDLSPDLPGERFTKALPSSDANEMRFEVLGMELEGQSSR